MALKVKAVERLLKFDKESAGKYRYVMKPEMYSSLTQAKVIKEAALRSGVSQGVMKACWDAAGEVIKAWATEGHSVALPGLGSMRFGLRSKAVENVNDVKTSLISSRRIIFTPSVDLKEELASAAIQITCIDRDGKEVKRVTSTSGEVIKAWATEGHSVALPGLGSMRFGLRSKSVENVNDVKTGLIKSRRIIFTPSVGLKDELANTSIVITCYDRNGNEVKRVTSTSGEVEDPENGNDNDNVNGNDNPNEGGEDDNGGGEPGADED